MDSELSIKQKLLNTAHNWWHRGFLLFIVSLMIWLRSKGYKKFISDDKVIFTGNDPWYHYRQVIYTINHWPNVMPFDPWTAYPTGTSVGAFGTFFDQIVATIALIIGLGSPSEKLAGVVLLFSTVVGGSLVAIPVYYITKSIATKNTGLIAAIFLALFPGLFFSKGMVGAADHNIIESLFMMTAGATVIYGINQSEKEPIILELLVNKEFESIRKSIAVSIITGIAIAAYLSVWPPGILFIGILSVYFAVYATIQQLRSKTAEPILFFGAISLFTTAIPMVFLFKEPTINPINYGYLQIFLPLLASLGCISLAGLSRVFEKHNLTNIYYPVILISTAVGGWVVIGFVAPKVASAFETNIIRFIGFGTNAQTRTIAEAKPFATTIEGAMRNLFIYYRIVGFLAIAGFVSLVIQIVQEEKELAKRVFVVVWFLFIFSAAFTQIRFNYYFAPLVAVTGAYSIYLINKTFDFRFIKPWEINISDHLDGVKIVKYSVIFILIVFIALSFVVVSPSVFSLSGERGVGGYSKWEGSLEWMAKNTPENGGLEYYGKYKETNNFDYSDESYGVMSWWDYGHWITVTGERIPVANPFQQNAKPAAKYLLATNHSEAQQVVENLDAKHSDDNVRYIMIDWQMVSPTNKLHAPATFHPNLQPSDLFNPLYSPNGQVVSTLRTQRYYESLLIKMYYYHGSQKRQQPIVVDYTLRQGRQGQSYLFVNQDSFKQFQSMRQAGRYVRNNRTAVIGGIGEAPREPVRALHHYRLVKASEVNATNSKAAAVKIFEHVTGAPINVSGPQNSTVQAVVELNVTSRNQTIYYRQSKRLGSNGEATLIVPYSTKGYNSKERYTNVSVKATGKYTISTTVIQNQTIKKYQKKVHVTERAVMEGEPAVSVNLNNKTQ